MTELHLEERRLSGAGVESPPARHVPRRSILEGTLVQLEPLDPAIHARELYAASHDGEAARKVWTYLPYGPFTDLEDFTSWLRDRAAEVDPLFFAVRDRASGRAAGVMSFLNIEPEHGSIEIGHIWLGPALQNTRQGTEALYLTMAHTFEQLQYRRLEWKCDALNDNSRRAALRLGFGFEGIFYQHRIVKGRNRDTAWYSLLNREWPSIKPNFLRWLSEDNFDELGQPRQSLYALNAALRSANE